MWRNSPNWQGGRDTFESEVKKTHAKVVDLPVSQNQGNYTNEILALKHQKATTVLAWVNVLEFAQLEKQAAQQGYFPRWVVAAFNLVTDTVGADINGSKGPRRSASGSRPSTTTATTRRRGPTRRRRCRPRTPSTTRATPSPTPTGRRGSRSSRRRRSWSTADQDCTRNKLAGMFLGGYKQNVAPLCDVDFARGHGKLGSFAFNFWQATKRGSANGWKQTDTCKESF